MKSLVLSKLVAVTLSAVGLAGCGGIASPRAKDGSAGISFRVSATPQRQLDMVVMVDNSNCLCTKLAKMNAPCATGEFLVQVDDASALAPGTLLEFVCR